MASIFATIGSNSRWDKPISSNSKPRLLGRLPLSNKA